MWFIKTPSNNNSASSNVVDSFGVGNSARSPLTAANVQAGSGIEDLSSPPKPKCVSGGTDSSADSGVGHWAVINFDTEAGRDEIDAVLQASHATDMLSGDNVDVRSSSVNIATMALEEKWSQVVMVMEYADKGSLQEGLDRGWLCADRSDVSLGPKMPAVLATAIEISGALKYLHECNVVHGDLSGWNIMLTSQAAGRADKSERGFCAKVADFGLARSLNVDAEILTKSYGCLTHQPPETLTKGSVSKATDVYSFGVLLWQMYTCSRPWSGLSHAQIIMMVGQQGAKLKWPACAHPEFRALAAACMECAPADRPGFEEIVQRLNVMNAQEAAMACPLGGSWE